MSLRPQLPTMQILSIWLKFRLPISIFSAKDTELCTEHCHTRPREYPCKMAFRSVQGTRVWQTDRQTICRNSQASSMLSAMPPNTCNIVRFRLVAFTGQLSLAIPRRVGGAMSASESWDMSRYTARCIGPVSAVSQCKPVSGWGLSKRRSAPNNGPYRTHCYSLTLKPHSARTGRTVFSQLPAAVVRHWANDGVVYAIQTWFK